MKRIILFFIFCSMLALFTACGSGANGNPTGTPGAAEWTWIRGTSTHTAVYGTKGTPTGNNTPGARESCVSWTDKSGNLWLFGGLSNGETLNDLWKFDGVNWTWVSGSSLANQPGNYGTKGTPAPGNIPGARLGAISWVDNNGNLWLFGGAGNDLSLLNDLWKFDGTNWTWVSGENGADRAGTYGRKGTPDAINAPGARLDAISWTDRDGNLWLFGGDGYDGAGSSGSLNDLWKFDGNNWTWINGSDLANQGGNYGTKGTPSATNVPGARSGAVSWADRQGNLWLFGGNGYVGGWALLNDLWKFDGNNWTWISGGARMSSQLGIYGNKGIAAAANTPGARSYAISWTDSSGNLWLFGGNGYDSAGGNAGDLNDLWKFDGKNWTWVGGTTSLDQMGNYGTQGTPAPDNIPASRSGAVSWTNRNGDLLIYGGYHVASGTMFDDLWSYNP
jgi:hypothetical protein